MTGFPINTYDGSLTLRTPPETVACKTCGTEYPTPDPDVQYPHGVITYRRGRWVLVCQDCVNKQKVMP